MKYTSKMEEEALADLQEIEEGERRELWQTVADVYNNVLFDQMAFELLPLNTWKDALHYIEQQRFALGKVIERIHLFYERAVIEGWENRSN